MNRLCQRGPTKLFYDYVPARQLRSSLMPTSRWKRSLEKLWMVRLMATYGTYARLLGEINMNIVQADSGAAKNRFGGTYKTSSPATAKPPAAQHKAVAIKALTSQTDINKTSKSPRPGVGGGKAQHAGNKSPPVKAALLKAATSGAALEKPTRKMRSSPKGKSLWSQAAGKLHVGSKKKNLPSDTLGGQLTRLSGGEGSVVFEVQSQIDIEEAEYTPRGFNRKTSKGSINANFSNLALYTMHTKDYLRYSKNMDQIQVNILTNEPPVIFNTKYVLRLPAFIGTLGKYLADFNTWWTQLRSRMGASLPPKLQHQGPPVIGMGPNASPRAAKALSPGHGPNNLVPHTPAGVNNMPSPRAAKNIKAKGKAKAKAGAGKAAEKAVPVSMFKSAAMFGA